MSLKFQGLYVIQTRECVDANNDVYKIGQSKNIGKALQKYPDGSKVFLVIECPNAAQHKNKIIRIFKKDSETETTYGKDFLKYDINMIFNLVNDYAYVMNKNFKICKTPFIITKYDENNKYILPKDRIVNNVICEKVNTYDETSQILEIINKNINTTKKLYRKLVEFFSVINKQELSTDEIKTYENIIVNSYNQIINLEDIKNGIS